MNMYLSRSVGLLPSTQDLGLGELKKTLTYLMGPKK